MSGYWAHHIEQVYFGFFKGDDLDSVVRLTGSDISSAAHDELVDDAHRCERTMRRVDRADWENAKAFGLCKRFDYYPGLDGGYLEVT